MRQRVPQLGQHGLQHVHLCKYQIRAAGIAAVLHVRNQTALYMVIPVGQHQIKNLVWPSPGVYRAGDRKPIIPETDP